MVPKHPLVRIPDQFLLLSDDRAPPTPRSPLRLLRPLKQMLEEYDHSTLDLAPVSPGHVFEILREVREVDRFNPLLANQLGHDIEPGGFVSLVKLW